jgi:hypothetical protein
LLGRLAEVQNGLWIGQEPIWDSPINRGSHCSKGASVRELSSAKFSNEAAYLFRKSAAFWSSNNADHQARIWHSTTVAGAAKTWGFGAMTNSYNDSAAGCRRRSRTSHDEGCFKGQQGRCSANVRHVIRSGADPDAADLSDRTRAQAVACARAFSHCERGGWSRWRLS